MRDKVRKKKDPNHYFEIEKINAYDPDAPTLKEFRFIVTHPKLIKQVCEVTGVNDMAARLLLTLALPDASKFSILDRCRIAGISPDTYYSYMMKYRGIINKFLREEADNIFATDLPDTARAVTKGAREGDPKMARLHLEREMGISRQLGDKDDGRSITINVAIAAQIGQNMGLLESGGEVIDIEGEEVEG